MPFPIEEKIYHSSEKELGVRFPESFREKMMKENGGSVAVGIGFYLHPFFDTSSKKRLKRTCNSISATKRDWEQYGLPKDYVNIGTNEYGDTLVFVRDANGKLENRVLARS